MYPRVPTHARLRSASAWHFAGGGRDRFGELAEALAAFLVGLFDMDGLWPQHLKLWELRRLPEDHDAVSVWLVSHALPNAFQIVMQGLSAMQQITLAGLVLSESLYGARQAFLSLLGTMVITTPVSPLGARPLGRRQALTRAFLPCPGHHRP